MPRPGDDERDREARRRAAIRLHHPDAGGSAEKLMAALETLGTPPPAVSFVPTRRGQLRRILRRRGRAPRTLQ